MSLKKYIKRKALKKYFKDKQQDTFNMGTDGITTEKFSKILDEEIEIIKRKVKNQTYNVSPYKQKLILKDENSHPRLISIPTNRDKLTFSALTSYLTDKFRDDLYDSTIYSKILDIKEHIQNNRFDMFIKLDIKDFYPSIDHDILIKKVEDKIDDDMALSLLQKSITAPTVSKSKTDKKVKKTKGLAQGLSHSGILSSIYFKDIDKKYHENTDIAYYRFVDDILILCKEEDVEKVLEDLLKDIENLKLTVHPVKKDSDKSTTGMIYHDRFQFLGYEFFNNTITVREKSIEKFRESIITLCKDFATEKYKKKEFEKLLNLKITDCIYKSKHLGWIHFFAHVDDMQLLFSLDAFIKKIFHQLDIPYEKEKIKKLTKSYWALKNIEKTNYIPKYYQQNKKIDQAIKKAILSVNYY